MADSGRWAGSGCLRRVAWLMLGSLWISGYLFLGRVIGLNVMVRVGASLKLGALDRHGHRAPHQAPCRRAALPAAA